MTTAIVTTLINAGNVLDFFITYHISIGFDHLFLFFDDPLDPSIRIAQKYPNVTVIRHDRYLRERWEKTRLLTTNRGYYGFIDRETMARQLLNVEIANQMALEKGITWLLHIDIDELFYAPGQTVAAHFKELADRGKDHITYANHEAIPETPYINNFFQEVSLFKKNISTLHAAQVEFIQKQSAFNYGKAYFLYYSIGKSAVKVDRHLIPLTVHSFLATVETLCSDPCILHFPVCGFEHFLKKYKTLGSFNDRWFGMVDIASNIPFHIHCRNEVGMNNESSALDFYKKRIMMTDKEMIGEFIKAGIFFRVEPYSQFLPDVV